MSAIIFPDVQLAQDASLRLSTPADAAEIFAVVERNREHLAQWLAWLPHTESANDIATYLATAQEEIARGTNVPCTIRHAQRVVGAISLHNIDRMHRCAEIGYWLAQDATGKGLATKAARALITYAGASLDSHRVELMAAVANLPSRRVAERLGMIEEATLRERLYLNGRFHDAVVYALLLG